MAVSAGYLTKIRTAIRRYNTMAAALEAELVDTIEECRADLIRLDILPSLAQSETDYHILDAVKRYARWRWEPDPNIAAKCAEEYKEKVDELRKTAAYTEESTDANA